ncbi:MAG: DUF4167 domain-containing protein [Rhodospirillaceae bacterium]
MNKGSNNRRSRGRGGKQRHGNIRNQSFESNGPGVKVRGTAQQVLDKYLALARDASSSGDRIAAESYFQFAEHYFRLLNTEDQRNGDRYQQREHGNGRTRMDTPAGAEGDPEDYQDDVDGDAIAADDGSDAAVADDVWEAQADQPRADDGADGGAEEGDDAADARELPGFITQSVDEKSAGEQPKRQGRGRRPKARADGDAGRQETDAAD